MKRAIAFALSSLALLSHTAMSKDLLGVYEDALKSDPTIREAEANRRASRESRPQAWSQLLPQLNGTGEISRSKTDGTTPSSGGVGTDPTDPTNNLPPGSVPIKSTTDSKQWTIQLRQSVFSWANWQTLRRANNQVAQAEADYQAAEQDLILRVAQRYFDVLSAKDNVDAEQAAQEAISRQLDQANKRFEVGLIAITDVQEAKAARDSSTAAVIASKRSLSTAEELLREYTDAQYSELARPNDTMPLQSPQPADAEKWVELSMDQNLSLVSSRLAADIARDNVGIARSGHLPTLDIVGSHGKVDDEDTRDYAGQRIYDHLDTDMKTDFIGLQVTVPLFSGGLTQSQVRQSQFLWIAAKERMTRVSRQTERAARDAYLGVISEISRVQALKQALESSQTALRATEAGYEVGTRTAVDVLNARQTLVRAQTDYARSRYDYILNVIQLKLAAGNLDRDTLREVNQWLAETQPLPSTAP
jgi:outer membrane protein